MPHIGLWGPETRRNMKIELREEQKRARRVRAEGGDLNEVYDKIHVLQAELQADQEAIDRDRVAKNRTSSRDKSTDR